MEPDYWLAQGNGKPGDPRRRNVPRQELEMNCYNVLVAYRRIFSQPRYENDALVPDGSAVLDCLAYGFSKLVEEIKVGDDIRLNENSLTLLGDLDARISQVAYSSKHWISIQEWDSVNAFAWKIIEALELDRPSDPQASDS